MKTKLHVIPLQQLETTEKRKFVGKKSFGFHALNTDFAFKTAISSEPLDERSDRLLLLLQQKKGKNETNTDIKKKLCCHS